MLAKKSGRILYLIVTVCGQIPWCFCADSSHMMAIFWEQIRRQPYGHFKSAWLYSGKTWCNFKSPLCLVWLQITLPKVQIPSLLCPRVFRWATRLIGWANLTPSKALSDRLVGARISYGWGPRVLQAIRCKQIGGLSLFEHAVYGNHTWHAMCTQKRVQFIFI